MGTVTATVRRSSTGIAIGKGDANNLRTPGVRTIELAASASGTVIDFAMRLPTNFRVSAGSRLYNDDLATSGSPTLDLGLYAVDANVTSDDDILTDGIALSSASTANVGVQVIKDFANSGKMLWEIMGLSSDPGGLVDVKGIVRDAATTATGTITLDIRGYMD